MKNVGQHKTKKLILKPIVFEFCVCLCLCVIFLIFFYLIFFLTKHKPKKKHILLLIWFKIVATFSCPQFIFKNLDNFVFCFNLNFNLNKIKTGFDLFYERKTLSKQTSLKWYTLSNSKHTSCVWKVLYKTMDSIHLRFFYVYS